jgi:cysteine desulfurase family protein (TIGR01976 family)
MTHVLAPLDVAAARGHFPALTRAVAGQPALYLDGPGGSQVPKTVIEAVAGYLERSNANLGGPFVTSEESVAVVEDARLAAADLTGARPEEIAFGPNMTTLNFLLAHAVARTLQPGDEIVVTQLDHDANVSPWLRIATDHELTVHTVPLRTADGTIDLTVLEEHLASDRVRVVAFTLASNALGTVTDARRIADIAHGAGALAWADGVHYAPHRRLDRDALGLDVLLCSPYKFFGPHLGIAAIRHDLARSWPADRVRPADEEPAGHRFETGTQSHEAQAGLIAAVDYLATLGDDETAGPAASRTERLDTAFARIAAHERTLTVRTLERLQGMAGVRLHGIADPARADERTPTFCLTFDRHTPREAAEALGREGIFTWDGNYYALEAIRALGLESTGGALRAGYLHYTTTDEVDRFLDRLEALAAG